MVRGSRRGVAALLIVSALGACTPGVANPVETTAPRSTSTSGDTTTTLATTTTTVATTTTTPATTTSNAPTTSTTSEVDADVRIPEGEGPFPAVVLVHGGGWVTGDPVIMEPLAEQLTSNGFLTVNTTYELATLEEASFPEAVRDVACAVSYASQLPDSDGTVAVIGHSAGAHIGAVVALTGDQYDSDCIANGNPMPARFVGLAGPYDVDRLGLAMLPFFGVVPDAAPEIWTAGNPQKLTSANPELEALIMYGERDGLVDPSFAIEFHEALLGAGADSLLELVEGARHNDMHDPELVGDLIITWLTR